MFLKMVLGLVLCWQVSANAAQSDVQTDRMEAVQAEVAKIQTLIGKYHLDLKLKLTVPKTAKATLAIDPTLAKTLNLKVFASRVNCDDDDDPSPRPGHGGHHDDDDNDNDKACVPYCEARWNDGSCQRWGADKCGHNIDCSPYCEARWNDGSCQRWGADICN